MWYFRLKVDLCSGCDSDVTSDEIIAMLKRYYCEIIARYCRFWFVLLTDYEKKNMISDGNFSAMVAISLESWIISTLLLQLAMILAMVSDDVRCRCGGIGCWKWHRKAVASLSHPEYKHTFRFYIPRGAAEGTIYTLSRECHIIYPVW